MYGFQVIFQNPFYSFNPQKTIRSAFEEMLGWNTRTDEQLASRQHRELLCRNEIRSEYRKQDVADQKEDALRRCLEPTGLPESALEKYPSAFSVRGVAAACRCAGIGRESAGVYLR